MSFESTVIAYKNRSSPIEVQKRTISSPLEDDFVVIKTSYAALNPLEMKLKAFSFFGGRTALLDFSGEIVEVADNLKNQFTKGERVCGALVDFGEAKSFVGSYSLVNVKRHSIIRTPSNLDEQQAAALPIVFQSALNILAKTKLNPYSRVLILGGATAVGSILIQLLKDVHHVKDIVVTCSPRSAAYVEQLGATHVVDYTSGDLSQKLVESANKGKYQAVIDTVGGYSALKVWRKLLVPIQDGSSYITISGNAEPGKKYSALVSWKLFTSLPGVFGRMIFGKWLGLNYTMLTAQDTSLLQKNEALLHNGGIEVRIDSIFPVSEGAKAWTKLDTVGAKGKVLIQF